MTDNIRSQLHHCLEDIDRGIANLSNDPVRRAEIVVARGVLAAAARLPHYVFEHELVELVRDHSIQKTVDAMFEAGVARLPYPAMSLELWGGSMARVFVVARATDTQTEFELVSITYVTDRHAMTSPLECLVAYLSEAEYRASDLPQTTDLKYGPPINGGGWRIKYHRSHVGQRRQEEQREIIAALATLNFALVMSHVGGLRRETIDPARLNRARVKSGKTHAVPTHVVVRIGHVYDRAGRVTGVTAEARRSMPIHMRAGYVRNQQHGEQWRTEHPELVHMPFFASDHHPALIPPVLVNYYNNESLPLPLPKSVRL